MQTEIVYTWEEDLREEGRRIGREEARQEGAQETILNVLQRRFGTFPVALASALSQVRTSQELTDLTIFASTAPSLEAFLDKLHSGLQHESLTKKQTG